jgi:hypothetical protein
VSEDENFESLAPVEVFNYFDEKLEGDKVLKEARYNSGMFFSIVSIAATAVLLAAHYHMWIAGLVIFGMIYLIGLVHLLISR